MTETILAISDSELLVDYARSKSESAFEKIVNRHIHLVHAAAVRQVRDTNCPTDEPLDIGTIRLTVLSKIEIGKPLPNVELLTPDGKSASPSLWNGKIVVLHLWEMHDRKFFPAIHQIADKFKDDPRIQIVNIGMEMLPVWARYIDATDHLPGLLLLDKLSSELDIREAYVHDAWIVQGLPYVLILDAQGNVAAKVSEPAELSAAIDKATAK